MTDAHDHTFADYDPTPLGSERPGDWVLSERDLFERERSSMEADIEDAVARATRARDRLAALRATHQQVAASQLDVQHELDALRQRHASELDRLRHDTDQHVQSVLEEARRAADDVLRAAMDPTDRSRL